MNYATLRDTPPLSTFDRHSAGKGALRRLKAKDIMTRPVVSAMKNASARDIALQILSGLYRCMPVIDGRGGVLGMVTESDLLEQLCKGRELVKLTAEDVMSKTPLTVDKDTPLDRVLEMMIESSITKLPVTGEGCLVGIIARCDILKIFIEPEFITCA